MFACKIANKQISLSTVMYTLLMFCIILILLLSGIGYEANSSVLHPTRYTWDPRPPDFAFRCYPPIARTLLG
jgi:hypothetical protein